MIDYLNFRKDFLDLGFFSLNQIRCRYPNFQHNNIVRWCDKGLLIPIRQGWYSFPECVKIPDMERRIANVIYSPSYISLHYTLCFYGMIPEAVMNITSVTTLKTCEFRNNFGTFVYKTVKPSFFFGYTAKVDREGKGFFMATPEKALLDLLYLYPFYKTEQDMLDLRLDEDFMEDEFNVDLMNDYLNRINSNALRVRVNTLLNAYNIN